MIYCSRDKFIQAHKSWEIFIKFYFIFLDSSADFVEFFHPPRRTKDELHVMLISSKIASLIYFDIFLNDLCACDKARSLFCICVDICEMIRGPKYC